jgi:hypothetical protein
MNNKLETTDLAALVAGHMSKDQLLKLIRALEETSEPISVQTAGVLSDNANREAIRLLKDGFYSWTGEHLE